LTMHLLHIAGEDDLSILPGEESKDDMISCSSLLE
jgi:hypothetical protein